MNPATHAQPAQVGEQVGAYVLLEKIEESAAIVAFAGRDPLLDRRVVVRQVLLSPGNDDARRLLAERVERYRGLARHHKRMVGIIETIDDPRGLFVVMEHAEGDSLDARLAHGQPIAPMSVLRIVRAVALALEPMHDQSMVHRDLRPGCLIITQGGAVRIGDFGLAGMAADTEGLNVASVRYMSPELCRGEAGDARSDLYAVGMIAYEMLIGRAAFDDVFSAVLRDTRQQAMRWVKWHTNPRNVAPPADQVVPHVPPILAQIVARLMEKDPARRIASARQLLDTIERHFSREAPSHADDQPPAASSAGVESQAVSSGGDTAALPRATRRPWMLIAVIAGLLLPCGYFAYQAWRSVAARAAAEARIEQVLRDAEAAYKAGDFAAARAWYAQVDAMDHAPLRLHAIARAGVQRCDAHLLLASGQFEPARAALAEAEAAGVFSRDALRELGEEIDARQATEAALDDIRRRMADGELDAARRALSEQRAAVVSDADRDRLDELFIELQGREAQRRAADVLARADELVHAGRLDDAIAELTERHLSLRAPALQARLDALVAQQKTVDFLARGDAAAASGDWAAAIVAYSEAARYSDDPAIAEQLAQAKMEAALADGRRLYAAQNPAGAAAAFTRALGYGDSVEARGYLARMQSTGRARALVRAGDDAMAAGEFVAAARHYEAAIEQGDTDAALPGRLNTARLRQFIAEGRDAMRRGDYDKARDAFDAAALLDPNAPGLADSRAELAVLVPYTTELERGDALLARGEYIAAKRAYAEARKLHDTPQVRARQDDAEYEHLVAQARSFMLSLRWESAEALLRSAARIHDTPLVRELMRRAAAREREGGDG